VLEYVIADDRVDGRVFIWKPRHVYPLGAELAG
jgi:hypothetical protein